MEPRDRSSVVLDEWTTENSTTARVVEMSVTVNHSRIQDRDYAHPDDHELQEHTECQDKLKNLGKWTKQRT